MENSENTFLFVLFAATCATTTGFTLGCDVAVIHDALLLLVRGW